MEGGIGIQDQAKISNIVHKHVYGGVSPSLEDASSKNYTST